MKGVTHCWRDLSTQSWVTCLGQKVWSGHRRERHSEPNHNSAADEYPSFLGDGLHYRSNDLEELPKLQYESSSKAISRNGSGKGAYEASDV